MWFTDLGLFVWIYLATLMWQIVAFPFINIFFSDLLDCGWAAARILSSIFISVIIFFLATAGLPINTNMGLFGGIIFLTMASFVVYKKNNLDLKKFLSEKWKIILIEELLIFSGIVFMGTMRGFRPGLDSLEKYMDFGFIYQYLLHAKLPVADMWFAGEKINYYSFGHFWSSILIRTWGVDPITGYNLLLAFHFGIDLALAFSVTINLLGKSSLVKRVIGGLISVSLLMLGGNSHIVWYLVTNRGFIEPVWHSPYWYALATRFIPNTIHEFPSYTFTIGDLHAHLMDLPIVLTFLMIFFTWDRLVIKKNLIIWEVSLGWMLGVMMMTNTWDAIVYLLMLFIYGVIKVASGKINWKVYAQKMIVVIGVMILAASPWWWSFRQISNGLAWVTDRSPLWQLLVLWFIQAIFGVSAWALFRKNAAVVSAIVLAFVLIILPEIFYFKDIYVTLPRANTMFKFTYQAFLIFSLMGGVAIIKLIEKRIWVLAIPMVILTGGLLIYPYTSYTNFYINFKKYEGVTNQSWLATDNPDKYEIMLYLRINRDGKNMVEYPGKSYSLSNAVSAFSGVPSILGWRTHEWLWRNSEERMIERTSEIKALYERPSGSMAKEVIEKYNLGWIVIGKEERENYKIDTDGILKLGEVVWKNGANLLIKIK